MEWLKAILEKAEFKDGVLNVASVMELVNAEFPKHAVPKKEFNDKVGELKAANDTITDLKKANGDNEELQNKITTYETEIKKLKAATENTRREYALKEKLTSAGVVDADYLIYKQGGIEKFAFDKDGNPIGVDDIVKPLKESMPHLFKVDKPAGYNPARGVDPDVGNPWAKETFNLTKQGELFKTDPARARELAAAAGAKL